MKLNILAFLLTFCGWTWSVVCFVARQEAWWNSIFGSIGLLVVAVCCASASIFRSKNIGVRIVGCVVLVLAVFSLVVFVVGFTPVGSWLG